MIENIIIITLSYIGVLIVTEVTHIVVYHLEQHCYFPIAKCFVIIFV